MTEKTKELIKGYIEEGLSTDVILKKFRRKYTRQQIAGIRAWVTRHDPSSSKKTYNRKNIRGITDSNKETMIKLFRKGKSCVEIMPKFKGCYSISQLAAVKAWVTMGKY